MIRRYQARIVCIGRREPDAAIAARISALAALGPAPEYLCGDVADRDALYALVDDIRRRHGAIHGVVHSAIGALDRSLVEMDEAGFLASLRPNVDGCANLAEAFSDAPLDFALFFSTVAVFSRDHGKSGYVAGSLYKNALARRWAALGTARVRIVDWGWWELGISDAMPATSRARVERMGVGALDMETAFDGLTHLLTGPQPELAMVRTTRREGREAILGTDAPTVRVQPGRTPSLLGALTASVAAEARTGTIEVRAARDRQGALHA